MAKLVDLIYITSIWSEIESRTISNLARNLREHELISSSGRGPGGAEMIIPDAANLLIGLTSPQAKFAPLHVQMVRETVADNRDTPPANHLASEREQPLFGENFGEDLESLISFAGYGHDQYGGRFEDFGINSYAVSISRDPAMLFVEASITLKTIDSQVWTYIYHSPKRRSHGSEPNFLNHVTIRQNLIDACARTVSGLADELPPMFTISEIDGGKKVA